MTAQEGQEPIRPGSFISHEVDRQLENIIYPIDYQKKIFNLQMEWIHFPNFEFIYVPAVELCFL